MKVFGLMKMSTWEDVEKYGGNILKLLDVGFMMDRMTSVGHLPSQKKVLISQTV